LQENILLKVAYFNNSDIQYSSYALVCMCTCVLLRFLFLYRLKLIY